MFRTCHQYLYVQYIQQQQRHNQSTTCTSKTRVQRHNQSTTCTSKTRVQRTEQSACSSVSLNSISK